MIYFTAHTFKCVCHCRRAMFRVLGMYNFGVGVKSDTVKKLKLFVFELLFCLFFQSSFLQLNYFLSNQIYPTINCGLSLAYQ